MRIEVLRFNCFGALSRQRRHTVNTPKTRIRATTTVTAPTTETWAIHNLDRFTWICGGSILDGRFQVDHTEAACAFNARQFGTREEALDWAYYMKLRGFHQLQVVRLA